MNCSVCGKPLPQGVSYCPNCGTPVSSSYPYAGTTPDSATIVSAPPPPPTNYGPQTYGAPPTYTTPSVPYDPYNVAPPPQAPRPQRNRMGLIIGVVVVVLILILGSIVALLLRGSQVTVPPAQATATAQAANSQATAQANAKATSQANAQASATATALQNIYNHATGGTPALSDPLSSQDNNNWDQGTLCSFNGGVYHASDSMQDNFAVCSDSSSNFSNFALQVQMVINKGDWGGFVFRSDKAIDNFYYLEVHQDATFDIRVYKNNSDFKSLTKGTSTSFKTGVGQSNIITIVAQGSNFYLFINGQFTTSTSDTNFTSGVIAVAAGDSTHPTDVSFSNLKAWKL
jgi:hypothetical protein